MAEAQTLEIRDLSIGVGEHSVVDGVDFSIGRGEIVALVGESGSGKSLTALSIMGLLSGSVHQTGGTATLEGQALELGNDAAMQKLRGTSLSMIFQEPIASLNPLLSVGAQVAESLIVHGRATSDEAWDRAVEMLRDVGIPAPEQRARQLPSELSGGMCQRVMIASALIAEPRLLIADEPTTALDVTIQAQILHLMRRLRDETDTSVLIITHDMGVVASVADRVCVMYGGRIVEQAEVHELFAAPRHPYTKLLLATIPRMDGPRKVELFSISGMVPDVSAWPEGCRFRTRCPLASDACATRPPLEAVGEGTDHVTACWHSDKVEGLA
ncbi:ABC transporter ATP-binding protein [Aquicoccus porphyridii]|uniref:ABC transporter ATP-binding protein n=1 Tax=Aquicoccus porphyridii TaxID=1852029 RepID=A0A5A9ZSS4_9RHOB|nr:ABC transporter ATP-binding protein [Aquicoccus porphyridii]KAA0920250.1 ABC transporter ATP-binding protein [Aquicoccus porphyridii]RAI54951.1 peptide ABC transporter ATP-binding protein [Rhodobacteraceae bacterium AsT-22]